MKAAFLCAFLLWAGCSALFATGRANVPAMAIDDVYGRTHYLSDHIGQKVVVMAFWATWCMPCRQELFVLEEMFRQHQAEGLDVLAVSTDGADSQAGVKPFVEQHALTIAVLLDTDTRVSALYNPRKQVPMLHIFDRSGRMVYSHSTFQPGEAAALRAKILEVLRAK